MSEISEGSRVRYKTEIIGNGLLMDVLEVSDKKALCMYAERNGPALIQDWFDVANLESVVEAEGGFVP